MEPSIVSLEQFPRVQGETDDRGRFQRAIDATPTGGVLWIPPGHYQADSLAIRKSIQLTFSQEAKVEAVDVDKDILKVEGEREELTYQLLEPAKREDQQLLLTEEPIGWKAGDMIVLTDETVRFSDRQQEINTEVHEIAMIDGNRVILRDFVRLPKAIAKQQGNVYRVFPLEGVTIHRLTFQMKEGSKRGIGIFMQYVRNAVINGLTGYRGAGSGVQIRKALHTQIRNFRILHPQVTGSGQGYGIQLFGGCVGAVVQDGYTVGCRHSVDLDGCFDVYVSRVTDFHSAGAAFMMSHNGFTSDIVFDQCQTYHTRGSGFVAESQGFEDPLQCTFHRFTLKHCTVVLNHSSHACVVFTAPCKDIEVLHCQFRYQTDQGMGLNNAGVRLCPMEAEIKISDCQIVGMRKAIDLQGRDFQRVEKGQSHLLLRDTLIERCDTVLFFANGTHQHVTLHRITCKQISSSLFHFHPKGSFRMFVVENLSVFESPQCTFCIGNFHGEPAKGSIGKIFSDQSYDFPASDSWTITYDDLFLSGDGESMMLSGSPTPSSRQPLPDGWVEGQRLILITKAGRWILYQGDNMKLKNKHETSICLDEQQRSITLIWKDGFWYQVE